ncbi:unnamed protein product, partial [Owenia fusiformis]
RTAKMVTYLYLSRVVYWMLWIIPLLVECGRRYSAAGRNSESRCGLGPTRYLAAPDIHPGVGDTCNYYACERGSYHLKSCPERFGVTRRFMKFGRQGIAQKFFPCIRSTHVCAKSTLNNTVSAAGVGISNSIGFVPKVNFCGIDLAIAVDVSCSISITNKVLVKQFVIDLIKRMKLGTGFVKVAGLTFGSKVNSIQFLDESRTAQRTYYNFERMKLEDKKCQTHTDKAMELIRDHIFNPRRGDRPDMKNVLILMSDGNTYHGPTPKNRIFKERTKAAGRDIRARGVESFVIGLPTATTKKKGQKRLEGVDEWLEIGGDDEHVYLLDNFNQLRAKIDQLISASCKDSEFKFW